MKIFAGENPLAKATVTLIHDHAGAECSAGASLQLLEMLAVKIEDQKLKEEINGRIVLLKLQIKKMSTFVDTFYKFVESLPEQEIKIEP
jgi:hypothetical protein